MQAAFYLQVGRSDVGILIPVPAASDPLSNVVHQQQPNALKQLLPTLKVRFSESTGSKTLLRYSAIEATVRTQSTLANDKLKPRPLEDEAKVDQWRAAVGPPPASAFGPKPCHGPFRLLYCAQPLVGSADQDGASSILLVCTFRHPEMIVGRSSIAALAVAAFFCSFACGQEPPPAKPVTLLGMMHEWEYPGWEFHGAHTGDAAVSDISAIESKAVLTTSDSADKVFDFYLKKLNVDSEGKHLNEAEGERVTSKRSILVQDASATRPHKLYIIAINEAKSSTTLVISRAEGEPKTYIAWSNYRQLWP